MRMRHAGVTQPIYWVSCFYRVVNRLPDSYRMNQVRFWPPLRKFTTLLHSWLRGTHHSPLTLRRLFLCAFGVPMSAIRVMALPFSQFRHRAILFAVLKSVAQCSYINDMVCHRCWSRLSISDVLLASPPPSSVAFWFHRFHLCRRAAVFAPATRLIITISTCV